MFDDQEPTVIQSLELTNNKEIKCSFWPTVKWTCNKIKSLWLTTTCKWQYIDALRWFHLYSLLILQVTVLKDKSKLCFAWWFKKYIYVGKIMLLPSSQAQSF